MQAYMAVQRKLLILIWALWQNDEAYIPRVGQEKRKASGNEEPKPLISPGSAGDKKEVAPAIAGATQDELPCDESLEAFFSLTSMQ